MLDCPTLTLNDGLASIEDGQVMVEKSTLEVDALPNDPPDTDGSPAIIMLYIQIDTHQKLK